MTKRPVKLLSIWIAISSVLILAGIILFALLGFNTSAEQKNSKTFEVEYDVVVDITTDAKADLKNACEKAFSENGLTVLTFNDVEEVDSESASKTGSGKYVFTFDGSASDEKLNAARSAVNTFIQTSLPANAELFVSIHGNAAEDFSEWIWRGALALAVAAVVVIVYAGFRFGFDAALTGATLFVHDIFLTLAVFAVARIPVYSFAPLVYAGIAAVLSLFFWLIQCAKMRENFKDPSYETLSAEEAVERSCKTSKRFVLCVAGAIAAALIVSVVAVLVACGLSFTGGAAIFLLPALVPVAVSLYSSLLFGPALHVPVKTAFDKARAKRKANLRYSGKAKSDKTKEN